MLHDSHCPPDLRHGEETKVGGDSVCEGQAEVRASAEQSEVERSSQSRASGIDHQADRLLLEDSLQKTCVERASTVRDVCVGESVHGS